MKRACSALTALVLLIPAVANASAITESESGRGWIGNLAGPNGNGPGGGYVAGNPNSFEGIGPGLYRDHFDFSVPTLGGTLTGATLSLSNPTLSTNPGFADGHGGGTNTFSVSSLGAYGTYGFANIGTGTLYGSASISGDGTVTISLDAAALAAITADQGSTFSLGGVNSGELTALGYDFYDTRLLGNPTTLTLDISPATPPPTATPEPASLTLLGMGFFAIGGIQFRRWRRTASGPSLVR